MNFAAETTCLPEAVKEARLGRFAAVLLGSSALLLLAFVLVAAGAITQQWFALPGIAFLGLLITQVHFLNKIARYRALQRRQIWLLSFAAHLVVFSVVLLYFRSFGALALVLPEVVSAAIHLVGLRLASVHLAAGA